MLIPIILNVVLTIFYVYELLIFARCILSFLPFYNKLVEWVYMATEPVLSPCRKLMDKFNVNLPIDFSPMIALLLLQFVQRIFVNIIYAIIL